MPPPKSLFALCVLCLPKRCVIPSLHSSIEGGVGWGGGDPE